MNFPARLMQAVDTLEELNARTGSQENAAWTIRDLRHAAGSFAAEDHVDGICPQCHAENVRANELGCVSLHNNSLGKTCTASGKPFHLAVVYG